MIWNRAFIVVSALATAAFVGILAVGVATEEPGKVAPFMRAVEGMAHETFALDCDISDL